MKYISSTNRSKARESHVSDYYITPIEDIKLFIKAFSETENVSWENMKILDPCAGGDEQHEMSYPEALKSFGSKCFETIDIREDSKAKTINDYLTYELSFNPNIIITNPPFNIALDVIKKAMDYVQDGGWVIMLLRLNFFGSKQRKQFWETYMPRYAFVHHKRIGFTESGSTDSIEYMHCCWQKGSNPEFCELKVI